MCVQVCDTERGREEGKARGSCSLKLLSLIKFSINFYPFFFVSFSLQFNRQTEVAARSGSTNVQRKYKVAKQEKQQKKKNTEKKTTNKKGKRNSEIRENQRSKVSKANATGRMIDAAPKSMQRI